jgi:hypothetical protein
MSATLPLPTKAQIKAQREAGFIASMAIDFDGVCASHYEKQSRRDEITAQIRALYEERNEIDCSIGFENTLLAAELKKRESNQWGNYKAQSEAWVVDLRKSTKRHLWVGTTDEGESPFLAYADQWQIRTAPIDQEIEDVADAC